MVWCWASADAGKLKAAMINNGSVMSRLFDVGAWAAVMLEVLKLENEKEMSLRQRMQKDPNVWPAPLVTGEIGHMQWMSLR